MHIYTATSNRQKEGYSRNTIFFRSLTRNPYLQSCSLFKVATWIKLTSQCSEATTQVEMGNREKSLVMHLQLSQQPPQCCTPQEHATIAKSYN